MENQYNKLNTRATLLIRLRNKHDDESWEEFTNYYSSYVFAVLKGMGVEFSELEDMSQSILLKLWKSLPDFEYKPEIGSFRSWLCTVIRRSVYNYFRDKKKTSEIISEESVKADVEKIAEKEWMIHIATLAWDSIADEFSESVKETYIRLSNGELAEEIAKDLNISRGTVYVYKERVQKALRKEVRRLNTELT
ncbi:MAG: sigma-70 family RNA polymerase sigma factor [Lentisphaeraceae bacterium]|nr:sigma-70 family RNA polymerase sigma factor [Lentisphaeraceae bacterium]